MLLLLCIYSISFVVNFVKGCNKSNTILQFVAAVVTFFFDRQPPLHNKSVAKLHACTLTSNKHP